MNTSEIPAWESLADGHLDAQDAVILDHLARLYEAVDPVPADLVERLQFAMTLDALTIELATLQDSPSRELAAARGDQASAINTLTFASDSLTTMITISSDGPDRVRLDGWITPGRTTSVELHQGSTKKQVSADADGRFVFDDVPHALTRFVLRDPATPSKPPVVTPAVEI